MAKEQGQSKGTNVKDIEWFAGHRRFDIECEVHIFILILILILVLVLILILILILVLVLILILILILILVLILILILVLVLILILILILILVLTLFPNSYHFVQALSNPHYIFHLATNKYFDDPAFVAYLNYLTYFRQPEYIKFLLYARASSSIYPSEKRTKLTSESRYPGPTLRILELLQQEQFRKDAIVPGVIERMLVEGSEAALTAHI
ncbi:hypothetical protein LTR62_007280 [Meristemomyces frigidus]|uniref:Mediator of RNA polymerase II transcription subunit 31 n=1 Tax=Meristemomyces frigidus TaxID=1508187 RepID=A0AAN7YDQ2_9PEZI|nr:hypothetical protein LTR62_007280 [Meristemomyces frigidus]